MSEPRFGYTCSSQRSAILRQYTNKTSFKMAIFADKSLTFLRVYAFTFMMIAYGLFIVVGAVVLMILEQPEENLLVKEVRELKARFLADNQCVEESSLDQLLMNVLSASKRGVATLDGDECNFDFTSSLFFVITFLTTTGYGTTVPLSDEGRVFCVVYCLVGIPFTLLLLSSLTHALLPWVTHTPIHNLQVFWGLSRNHAALLHCSVLAFCTATLFFLLPAGALCLLENDWNYLESLYFCFISLSTTGLVDYLPGRTQSRAARQGLEFATSCYLMLGLTVLLVVMESFWELQQVQGILRFFAGPRQGELKGVGLDELVLSGDMAGAEEEPHYSLPISTISPAFSDSPATPTIELPPIFGLTPIASSKENVPSSLRPSPTPDMCQSTSTR
ncbi:potassium channel, subfamily K, member 7 isoform X2 [Labeo rohita]|uniref:potassium channel, subfamily K, member 7 isoform X2 n=1 Tax=Labeo rohita TaxID=84645 RepID=UPI0021E30EBB|nr:potassium channel, subfamily K, member 7 isoform X2 [Labeo rohita]